MSSLADRLRRVYGATLRPTSTAEPRVSDAPPEVQPTARVERAGVADLPARELETAAGRCLLVEARYPLDHSHGGVPLASWLELPVLAVRCLARRRDLPPIDLRATVFLDTETTGLAGGTGTTAFLIGLGCFTDDAFVVRQLFMRDFGEERALLLALEEALRPFRYAVTFNGKSFDLPLLEARFVLARLRRPWAPELHLDLLHPARRFWQARFQSCSLATLEEGVLGHRRALDVPSWMIPSLYASYLREGRAEPLQRVFSHNRHDVLSLVALAAQLGRRLAMPLAGDLGPDELLAAARVYEELGHRELACACLEAGLERAEPPLRQRLQLQLALLYRRTGQRERAFALWRELASARSFALVGLIEMAKHLEHQQRDVGAALELVEQALGILELRELRDGAWRWRAERADLERRLARLRRKRGLGAGPGTAPARADPPTIEQ